MSPQETTGRTSRQAALEVAALLAVAAVYIWTRWQLLDVPLDRDEGAFGVVGQAILRGELPYRDVLDHKPPGVFYLYALALEVFPATARGVHQFLLVWNETLDPPIPPDEAERIINYVAGRELEKGSRR